MDSEGARNQSLYLHVIDLPVYQFNREMQGPFGLMLQIMGLGRNYRPGAGGVVGVGMNPFAMPFVPP
jgi:hypothetical protein